MTVRLIDCLCGRHAAATEHRWPTSGTLNKLIGECPGCRTRTDNQSDAFGNLLVRSLPDLVGYDYEHQTATHEAAHAVIAVLTGHPVNYVQVETYTAAIQTTPGGHLNLGPYSIDIHDHLAMLWAGQEAGLRWLRSNGMDTTANRVDVRFLGWDDLARGDEWVAKYGLAADTGRDRCLELLDVHWSAIERVADRLARTRRLTGDEVADLAGLACRAGR